MAYFLAEFSSLVDKEAPPEYTLLVDSVSNVKGSGTWIILEGPRNLIIEQELKFEFKANNNQVEYEVLITYMILPLKMGASRLKSKSDSQLVANQVSRQYQAK